MNPQWKAVFTTSKTMPSLSFACSESAIVRIYQNFLAPISPSNKFSSRINVYQVEITSISSFSCAFSASWFKSELNLIRRWQSWTQMSYSSWRDSRLFSQGHSSTGNCSNRSDVIAKLSKSFMLFSYLTALTVPRSRSERDPMQQKRRRTAAQKANWQRMRRSWPMTSKSLRRMLLTWRKRTRTWMINTSDRWLTVKTCVNVSPNRSKTQRFSAFNHSARTCSMCPIFSRQRPKLFRKRKSIRIHI